MSDVIHSQELRYFEALKPILQAILAQEPIMNIRGINLWPFLDSATQQEVLTMINTNFSLTHSNSWELRDVMRLKIFHRITNLIECEDVKSRLKYQMFLDDLAQHSRLFKALKYYQSQNKKI